MQRLLDAKAEEPEEIARVRITAAGTLVDPPRTPDLTAEETRMLELVRESVGKNEGKPVIHAQIRKCWRKDKQFPTRVLTQLVKKGSLTKEKKRGGRYRLA